MSANIGIVCPECNGKLKSYYKRRKGQMVRRCYRCLNAACPARLRGEEVFVHTNERFWTSRRKPVNSANRMSRKNAPDIRQTRLDFDGPESKIDAARK